MKNARDAYSVKWCVQSFTRVPEPEPLRIKVVKWESVGCYLPLTCQSCEKPFCVEVCPTKACHVDEENQRVTIDKDKCIGCKTCIIACPFGAPLYDKVEKISIKCDYCDGNPQCVAFCNVKAVDYIEADRINLAKKREVLSSLPRNAQKPDELVAQAWWVPKS
jgi:Fe-S-cluster-containing dehydrogenase component